jgi:DNA processing protein
MPPIKPTDDIAALEEEGRITPEVVAHVEMDIEEMTALLLLDGIKGFGPQKFKELHLAGLEPRAVLEEPGLLPIPGKRGDAFRAELTRLGEDDRVQARGRAIRQIVRAHENQARILTYRSPHYPRNVLESNNPVPYLYARGSTGLLHQSRAVACVGSREIRLPYSERHRSFANTAVKDGFAVVSGFATGADRIGHEAAFESRGETVLVMPCGLDRPFPPENRDLWAELLDYSGALVVSEFHFGTKASGLTLRKRNKLIVAFALGVLVSQSSATGGAMNAYRFALEQRKQAATFRPDGSPATTGNYVIGAGPSHRGQGKDEDLFGSDRPTVFDAEADTPSEWQRWLHQLSSST